MLRPPSEPRTTTTYHYGRWYYVADGSREWFESQPFGSAEQARSAVNNSTTTYVIFKKVRVEVATEVVGEVVPRTGWAGVERGQNPSPEREGDACSCCNPSGGQGAEGGNKEGYAVADTPRGVTAEMAVANTPTPLPKITSDLLARNGACRDMIDWFNNRFPKGEVTFTPAAVDEWEKSATVYDLKLISYNMDWFADTWGFRSEWERRNKMLASKSEWRRRDKAVIKMTAELLAENWH